MKTNNNIWYLKDESFDDVWHKLLFLPEISALSDEFEFMEDYQSTEKYGYRHKKGNRLVMDYGCMSNCIKKGYLKKIVEDENN